MKQIFLIIIFIFCLTSNLSAERDWSMKKDRVEYEQINTIECYDSVNCFTFIRDTDISRIYKSEDQGDTWLEIYENNHTPKKDSIWSLFYGFILDSEYIYHTYTDRMIIERSTNGGETFERMTFGEWSWDKKNRFYDLNMYDRKLGAAVALKEIVLTRDNWETYEIIKKDSTRKLLGDDVYFLDSNTILNTKFFRWGHEFMIYEIAEKRWSQYSFGEKYEEGDIKWKHLYDFDFVNDSVAYAAGSQDTIQNSFAKDIVWKTTDRGRTWKIVLDQVHEPMFGLQDIAFRTEDHGIAVGSWGKIVETTDGGKTWNYIKPPDDLTAPGLVIEWAGEYAIASDCCSGIYRLDPLPVGVDNREIMEEERVKIRQSKDNLLISIEDRTYRKYNLIIYDIMGKKVQINQLNSGLGVLFQPIDISKLKTGAYLFRIITNGELIESGKFICD